MLDTVLDDFESAASADSAIPAFEPQGCGWLVSPYSFAEHGIFRALAAATSGRVSVTRGAITDLKPALQPKE
ncbi:hypothetical protein SAMN05443244_3220 [Terriglobus roseus]|uniref:Uncharacterized protein n=1 Tax=Terriglobus roseus TaxID=392734 RepID=A0A1H4RPW2_9BACT|nr:hypothetical protein SAMN05443244_3220 [Terriglobus roseus]